MLKMLRERDEARGGSSATSVSLDVCIAMDTTSSMKPYLDHAKRSAESFFEIVRGVLKEDGGSSPTFRFAFISYKDRDFLDKNLQHGHLQYCDFTTDSSVAVEKLAGIHAVGGGDIAEDVGDALEKASALEWKGDFRVLIHFLDAPPHGSANHDLDERYDARLEDLTDIASLVRSLASNRIDYVMVRCGGDAEQKYTEKFARLCEATYKDARQSFMEQRALGHLPRFKSFLLDTSDASQFLDVLLQVDGGPGWWWCKGEHLQGLLKQETICTARENCIIC